ncbi:ligand-gated ion channel domain-containing protein [Phthorimaea operculella]|nr:ligand-gated ion channel domain-containing protein [Phthorimaea operculella]
MKLTIVKLTILFHWKIVLAISHEDLVKMAIDLVESYEKPIGVTAFLCWEMGVKMELTKRLANLKRPTTIRFLSETVEISKVAAPEETFTIAELNCSGVKDFLEESNRTNMFGSPYRWLILGHESNDNKIPPQLEALNIHADSEVLVAQERTKDSVEIHLSHSINHWGYQQILPLYQFLNATRRYFFANNWGYFEKGKWNGVVGNLIRGDADFSGTPIFLTKERITLIVYISDAIQTSAKFVFREPPLSYQNNLFLLPFNKTVWWSLGGFVMIMMIVIYLNAQWEVKKSDILGLDNNDVKDCDSKLTISDVAMMIVGAISQQGSFVELRGSIGRLVMFNLLLAFLFLFTAYSASIVALLQSSSKQIRTLSDLLNSRLELGVENTTYNIHYFTTATDPVRKAIYETKVAPKGLTPNFMSLEDGVKKLQKHPFAFNMDIGLGYRTVEKFFYEHEKCGLQEIAYIPTSKPWLTCRKDSPYAELFKIGIFRIREHGMSDRANRLVYSRKPVCSRSGGSFDSVSIVDVYPSLLMLLYGILLACALLAVEVLFHRQQNKVNDDTESIQSVPSAS